MLKLEGMQLKIYDRSVNTFEGREQCFIYKTKKLIKKRPGQLD